VSLECFACLVLGFAAGVVLGVWLGGSHSVEPRPQSTADTQKMRRDIEAQIEAAKRSLAKRVA
jgi:hypothetical protein